MSKNEFLAELAKRLAALPQSEIDKSVEYYSELIDDRIDEGMSEEEAVAALGNINDIVRNIMLDAPLATVIKSKTKNRRRLETWEIILLVVCSPFWVPLAFSIITAVFSVYISIWAVIISIWAALIAIIISAIVAIPAALAIMCQTIYGGLFVLGVALVILGFVFPAICAVKFITVMLVKLTVKFVRLIKSAILGQKTKGDKN